MLGFATDSQNTQQGPPGAAHDPPRGETQHRVPAVPAPQWVLPAAAGGKEERKETKGRPLQRPAPDLRGSEGVAGATGPPAGTEGRHRSGYSSTAEAEGAVAR